MDDINAIEYQWFMMVMGVGNDDDGLMKYYDFLWIKFYLSKYKMFEGVEVIGDLQRIKICGLFYENVVSYCYCDYYCYDCYFNILISSSCLY